MWIKKKGRNFEGKKEIFGYEGVETAALEEKIAGVTDRF